MKQLIITSLLAVLLGQNLCAEEPAVSGVTTFEHRKSAVFTGFDHGMGIGGWLTNYKRFHVLPQQKRLLITVGDLEHFGTYITEADVKYISQLGMDHIRLGFDQIVIEQSSGVFRESVIKKMEEFVGWCEKYNLNVVLNLHKAIGNYADIAEPVGLLDSKELQDGFVQLWVNLEKRFSDKPKVAFELLNEVRDVPPALWNNLAENTINAIRKMNKDRIIIIGSTAWNSPHKLAQLQLFDDEKVIYTFHIYDPFEFTHQRGVLQSGPLFYNRKMEWPGDIAKYRDYQSVVNGNKNAYLKYDKMDIQFIRDCLAPAIQWTKEHPDKILWCGEFGTIRHADMEWRENWMRDVITVLKENGIPYCVWNYLSTPNDGNRFSLVDDDSRKILSERMKKIILGEVSH